MNDRELLVQGLWRGVDPLADRSDPQGWGSDHPYLKDAIVQLRPRFVVEVGVWKGASVLTMAAAMRDHGVRGTIIAVDTWLGSYEQWLNGEWFPSLCIEDGYPTLFRTFQANIMRAGVGEYVLPLPLDSLNAATLIREIGIPIDLIHIDAGHSYESVSSDLRSWWPLLRQGGVLIGDDYSSAWPDVVKAFNDFFAESAIEIRDYKCRITKTETSCRDNG